MARWPFEEGLDPLWRPLLGRVEPDLLDPSERGRLFVEAKRSNDGPGVRPATAQGVRRPLAIFSQRRRPTPDSVPGSCLRR